MNYERAELYKCSLFHKKWFTNELVCACLAPRNEYLCFQKITKLEYSIPEGFPDNATDLVTRLLVGLV